MNVPMPFLVLITLLGLLIATATYLKRCGTLRTMLKMSAKLACSAHHISGFSPRRIHRDLRNYSPLFGLVTIHQDSDGTSATLANLVTVRACYNPALEDGFLGQHKNAGSPTLLGADLAPAKNTLPHRHRKLTSHPLQALLKDQMTRDNALGLDTRALVVIRGKDVLGEAYGAGIVADTRLLGWSMTKSLLAMLYGRMEALGLAESTASDLFPEWSADDRSEIKLQNLLQMCDGLAFDESYRPGSDATKMLFGELPPSRYALQRALLNKPGTHFSYSSGSTNLLARWIHRRLGGTEATLTFWQREFLRPLGLTNTVMEVDDDGVFVGSSYGYATARDWGRLGSVFLSGGSVSAMGRSATLLERDWIARATKPNHSKNDPRYGYQLWLNYGGETAPPYPRLPADSFFMLGNREQKLMVAPSHNAVIVRLGWSASPYPIEERFSEILDTLVQ